MSAADTRAKDAARQAGWELDAMIELMLDRVGPNHTAGTPEEHEVWMQIRGMAMRMKTLTSVLMSANDAEHGEHDADSMERMVYGRAAA